MAHVNCTVWWCKDTRSSRTCYADELIYLSYPILSLTVHTNIQTNIMVLSCMWILCMYLLMADYIFRGIWDDVLPDRIIYRYLYIYIYINRHHQLLHSQDTFRHPWHMQDKSTMKKRRRKEERGKRKWESGRSKEEGGKMCEISFVLFPNSIQLNPF